MDKTAIEKIEAMSKPNTIGIGGRMYTDKRIFAVEEPEVDSVALSTLSGLVDIVKQERQKFPEKLVVHVVSPYKVNVYSSIRKVNFCCGCLRVRRLHCMKQTAVHGSWKRGKTLRTICANR